MIRTPSSFCLAARAALGLASLLVISVPRPARADEPAAPSAALPAATSGQGFGADGQWALTIQSLGAGKGSPSLFFQKVSGGDWSAAVEPSLDYFLAGGVSLGGVIGFTYGSGTTTLGVGPRAGFNQAFGDHLSFWPTLGVMVTHQTGNHSSSTTTVAQVFAPFLYHPAPHFFVGAGPFYESQVQGSGSYAVYGVDVTLGGWL